MAGQSTTDCFSDGQFSLDTFDAIVLTDSSDLSADGLGVSSGAAFPFRAEQLTYLSCWI